MINIPKEQLKETLKDYIGEDGKIKITDDMSEDLKQSINIVNSMDVDIFETTDDSSDEIDDDTDIDTIDFSSEITDYDTDDDESDSYIEDIDDEELDESEINDLNSLF